MQNGAGTRVRVLVVLLAGLTALTALVAAPNGDATAKAKAKAKAAAVPVTVMTRNIFLGADLTPGVEAKNAKEFVDANGAILREVDQTNFPLRARALGKEIRNNDPDLVGLQEVALWRDAPPDFNTATNNAPTATNVRYDFLKLLLAQINKGQGERKDRYKVAVVQEEFDFEAPANEDGNDDTGPLGGEINGRLTMRDVILARKGAGVRISNAQGGNFENKLVVKVSGVEIPVDRGWTRVDARIRGSEKLRFVNSHLEAFDDETQRPSIRALQAGELVEPGGPATGKKRLVLLGDFNSDVPGVQPGDEQAFQVLLDAGFAERGVKGPVTCCVSSLFTSPPSEFDHQVDHILSDSGNKVKQVDSSVVGREKKRGLYPSDHAGIVSELKIR